MVNKEAATIGFNELTLSRGLLLLLLSFAEHMVISSTHNRVVSGMLISISWVCGYEVEYEYAKCKTTMIHPYLSSLSSFSRLRNGERGRKCAGAEEEGTKARGGHRTPRAPYFSISPFSLCFPSFLAVSPRKGRTHFVQKIPWKVSELISFIIL